VIGLLDCAQSSVDEARKLASLPNGIAEAVGRRHVTTTIFAKGSMQSPGQLHQIPV
jgi:hypothetical protein